MVLIHAIIWITNYSLTDPEGMKAEMAQVLSVQVQVLRLQVQVRILKPTISDANEIEQDS